MIPTPTVYNPGLLWTCFHLNGLSNDLTHARDIERRLARVLEQWRGTPYATGVLEQGVGAHCTGFATRVLDELYRRPPTPMPAIPVDASFHSRRSAMRGLKWFLRRYPNHERVTGEVPWRVEPGDLLITGPIDGGPGHVLMVGPQENTLWQSTSAGVHFTGLAIPSSQVLHAVYRLKDRHLWR